MKTKAKQMASKTCQQKCQQDFQVSKNPVNKRTSMKNRRENTPKPERKTISDQYLIYHNHL